jgi:alpha/beta hydrolase fold
VHGSDQFFGMSGKGCRLPDGACHFDECVRREEGGAMEGKMFYRTVGVDGLSIFYREAGPKGAPSILLLHGLPSSSRMFQPLLTRLADSYHLVAPDYPGFGHSAWPDPRQFDYTFGHIATIMNDFTQALGLSRYALYLQDYGRPSWLSNGAGTPGAGAGPHRPGCGGSQRRPGSELGNKAGILGGSAGL